MSLIPASTAKMLAKLVVTSLFDVVRSALRVKPKGPKTVPLSHKDVAHQQAQIKAGARPFPPPRRR